MKAWRDVRRFASAILKGASALAIQRRKGFYRDR
jgi:hypothetical protein